MKRACQNALILVLAVFAVACTGNVNGKFFQDLNNNGKLDFGENLANDVNYTVKKDGKEIYKGQGPTFSFHAEKGVYCVTINNRQNEEPVNPFLNRQLGSKQLGGDNDDAANEESNNDAASPPPASENSTDLAAEAEANGDGDKCVEKKNFAGDLDFEMPVAVNYMAQLTRIPQGQPCKLKPESSCVVEIRYPCGCELKDLFVPSDVMSVIPGQGRYRHAFDENLGSVSFAQSANGLVNAGDEVCSTQMTLQAHSDVEPGVYPPFTLTPEAKCPDKTYALRPITVELTAKVELRLEQQMLNSPGAGDTMFVSMTLNNNGHTAVKNCEISCAYPDDVMASDRDDRDDHDCDGRFLNHPAVCACDMLASDSGKRFNVQYTLPEDVPNVRNIEFRCTVTADNLEEVVSSKLELRLTPPE